MSNRPAVFVLLVVFLQNPIGFAQEAGGDNNAEDQMIAEALWSLVTSDGGKPQATIQAFDQAATSMADSAKIAFWRGRCELHARDTSRAFSELSEIDDDILAELNKAGAKGEIPRSLQTEIEVAVKKIRHRIQHRMKEQTDGSEAAPFEWSLLRAVALDPTMTAAWAALLESDDASIAITAAEAWAALESDNALPLYAKAAILTRGRKGGEPIDVAAIEALENGNKRPACRACDAPWPTDFVLNFPSSLPDGAADLEGKPVTPSKLRQIVETGFTQFDAFTAGNTISSESMRGLHYLILSLSHRLPRDEDIRYLRAAAGVAVHLVQSNKASYALTGGTGVLARLETIAVANGDFAHARQFASVRKYLVNTSRKVADGYLALSATQRTLQADLKATEIMLANRIKISIPPIDFPPTSEGAVAEGDSVVGNVSMVILNLFYSSDDRIFACMPVQSRPPEVLHSDELSKLGYATLPNAIASVRQSNLEHSTSLGVILVTSSLRIGAELGHDCYFGGYVGHRAPCVVVFAHRQQVQDFPKWHPSLGLRLAQILGPGDQLVSEDLDELLGATDLVVVPSRRLVDQDGRLLPLVQSCGLKFLAIADSPGALDHLKAADCIAGWISREQWTD